MNKKPIVYAFIDSQNLNLGIQTAGWKLDFRKFKPYLTNKFGVDALRHSLEYKNDQHRRSVETLGLSGHGDTNNVAKKPQKVNDRKHT
ncbi:hypothetical protein IPL85_05595 [Candidatus Saccharibacteria bacterium]|nr:MAG: hypothetical protein IPL85_05595 [Candidatus Saccharibacteria bacterium]